MEQVANYVMPRISSLRTGVDEAVLARRLNLYMVEDVALT